MTPEEARSVAGGHVGRIGGVLQALRGIVLAQGFVSEDDQSVVADVFNISRADVRGIVSFYEDLKTHPPARQVVRICQAEACQAVGGRGLTQTLEERLGVRIDEEGETGGERGNEGVGLEAVYCLGLCAQGPALTINDRAYVRADDLNLEEVLGLSKASAGNGDD